MSEQTKSAFTDYQEVQAIWNRAVAGQLEEVSISQGLADRLLTLYGIEAIERSVPYAVGAWLRKCKREGRCPTEDLNYFRNYVMTCVRAERDQQLVRKRAA
jgi:hypothetical protein